MSLLKRSTQKTEYGLALGSAAVGGIFMIVTMIAIEWALGYEIFWQVLTFTGIGAAVGFLLGFYVENYTGTLNNEESYK